MYLPINSIEDCKKSQNDISKFENWYRISSLNVNVLKCSQINFTRCKNPIIFNYFIKTYINDLGLTLSNNLNF